MTDGEGVASKVLPECPLSEQVKQEFIRHAHRILWEGYSSLVPSSLHDAEEPAITGLLVAGMRAFIEGPDSPEWVLDYAVHDDPPVHSPSDDKREGKRRPRVDLILERCGRRGPHPRFPWEAKRLGRGATRADYLGTDGLGCFLEARYPIPSGVAGMLGYIQEGTCPWWADQIWRKLRLTPDEICIEGGPTCLFRSIHALGPEEIDVFHTLLDFTGHPEPCASQD